MLQDWFPPPAITPHPPPPPNNEKQKPKKIDMKLTHTVTHKDFEVLRIISFTTVF